jgi:hypothetical protein
MKTCKSGCGDTMKKGGPKVTKIKKMAAGGSAGLVGMPMYPNDPKSPFGNVLKKGGSASLPVCTGGLTRMPDGSCGNRKFKSGGATKNAKLAAVAAPKNKITRAGVLTRMLKKKK